jgi:chloramphenicol-sensitive protein RarD
MNKGILYAVSAYLFWGILPIYWKFLKAVPAAQILAHRMVWSLVFMLFLIAYRKKLSRLKEILTNRRLLLALVVAACLLSVNWLTYIWGVNAGYIVETSLGYFINPLVNVLLGVLFLRERLRPWQWLPVGLAAVGVLYLTFMYGALPWIALVLAFTFAFYGLVKKTAAMEAQYSLTLETGIMFVPAFVYLIWLQIQGTGYLFTAGFTTTFLLIFTGVVTALPLLLFGLGARLIHLSTIGILQYIAPTMQFLIGVLIYKETFPQERLIGFSIVWLALIIFTLEGFWSRRKRRRVSPKSQASI